LRVLFLLRFGAAATVVEVRNAGSIGIFVLVVILKFPARVGRAAQAVLIATASSRLWFPTESTLRAAVTSSLALRCSTAGFRPEARRMRVSIGSRG